MRRFRVLTGLNGGVGAMFWDAERFNGGMITMLCSEDGISCGYLCDAAG